MTIALLLILWLAIIGLFNYIDYRITRNGGKPDYTKYFVWRSGAAIVHGALLLIVNEDAYTNYGSLSGWQLLLLWLPYAGFQICSFWIAYELIRNAWTHKPMLYFDTVEHDSGLPDKIFAKLGHTFHAFAKVLALAVAVLCVFLIYNRH